VGQTYSGDITISPERHEFNMSKLFTNASKEDAEILIQSGRRAVWPKIERIRNTTQISRTITACLQRLAKKYRYVKR
jgi:NTE family protein